MKNIVVSGISQGIGFELVNILKSENKIFGLTSSPDKAKTKINHPNVELISFDFLSNNAFDISHLMPDNIDILINNAGMLINKPFESLTSDDVEKTLKINFTGPLHLIQALLPKLKNSPEAHVVNIGSMGGFQGSQKFPGLAIYSASKGALATLTECLAAEFAQTTVRFNCLALGAVQTEMLQHAFPDYKAPLSPAEIAMFIADFALNGRKYFNGKILPVALTTP